MLGLVGAVLVKVSFFATLVASFLYYRLHRKADSVPASLARTSYVLAVGSLIGAAGILLSLILTHQFQYTYVWSYSSTDLPFPLLFSTLYAGQEGSFMLWALFTSIIGLFLMRYAARKDYEPEVMSIYGLILGFLTLMLIVKNPFMYIWDSFPKDLIHTGAIPSGVSNIVVLDAAKSQWAQFPAEGRGLNPLLQNYWMVIHPQILFLGFSAMAVPYANALAALLKRDYTSWIKVSTPWLVFGAMILGTGIIMGGYWAYETLGWGGYWAWDPVENSSLVPWLFCVASLHTMLVQRKTGAAVRSNFVLGILTFVAVLYSTFLTRSGVLGDTSVHSFVDPGMWVYWLLLGCLFFFGGIGFGLFFARIKEMPKPKTEHSMLSKESAIILGAFTLAFVALIVTIGTSSPIVTQILKGKASAMDISYYVNTNLPLGILIAVLSGVGQLLWWKSSQTGPLLRGIIAPIVLALATTLGVLIIGSMEPLVLLFVFCAAFSLFANLKVGYDVYMGNPKFVGGSLAHIGLAIMFIGFVTSERYDSVKTLSLERGKPVEALGYRMTYVGYAPTERQRYAFKVEVERNGRSHTVAPTMYFSDFTQSLMRHPDVINFLNKDLYVAPLSLEEAGGSTEKSLEMKKGDQAVVDGLTVRFADFDVGDTQLESMMAGNGFKIGAVFEVRESQYASPRKVEVFMQSSGRGMPSFIPDTYTSTKGKKYEFNLKRMSPNQDDPSQSKVEIMVKLPPPEGPQRGETLVVEASIKPMINLVWAGMVTLLIGFVLTLLRRLKEARERERWSA